MACEHDGPGPYFVPKLLHDMVCNFDPPVCEHGQGGPHLVYGVEDVRFCHGPTLELRGSA